MINHTNTLWGSKSFILDFIEIIFREFYSMKLNSKKSNFYDIKFE